MMKAGQKLTSEMKWENKDGRLIVQDRTLKHKIFTRFNSFRYQYCVSHRRAKLWLPFRQGKINFLTIIYGLKLWLFGGN